MISKTSFQLDRSIKTPFYQQLYDRIKHRIKIGELKPGEAFPSERELVENLGITRPTLRQALVQLEAEGFIRRQQGVGTFVEQPDRWKQEQKVLQLGVITWTTGFGGYQRDLVGLICSEAVSRGMEVKTFARGGMYGVFQDLARRVAEGSLDGVITFPTSLRGNMQQLAEIPLPKVMLEIRERQPDLDHVVIDSSRGIHDGVKELVRLGHREIGFVGALICDHDPGREGLFKMAQDSEWRFQAYRRALEIEGVPYKPLLYDELPFTDEEVNAWVKRRHESGQLPTALVAFDDLMALLLSHGCTACGLSVPGDVSILGFGNILPEAQRGEIATAVFDLPAMARLAVQRIQERVLSGGLAGLTLPVDSRFKLGRSIGAPNRRT